MYCTRMCAVVWYVRYFMIREVCKVCGLLLEIRVFVRHVDC